jgi:hypothetical protein
MCENVYVFSYFVPTCNHMHLSYHLKTHNFLTLKLLLLFVDFMITVHFSVLIVVQIPLAHAIYPDYTPLAAIIDLSSKTFWVFVYCT